VLFLNVRFVAGFSDATLGFFELVVVLPGVGEALKHEIARVLNEIVPRTLWGFAARFEVRI
jgi:hypothetical protein